MRLSQALKGFCLDRKARGYSPKTIQLYQINLGVFVEFLEDMEIGEVSDGNIIRFFCYLRDDYQPKRFGGDTRPLTPASVDNYWIALRSSFKWADGEFDTGRPDHSVPQPRYKNPVRKPFTKDEIIAMVKASTTCTIKPHDGRDGWSYKLKLADRNKAIILLLDTGMRLGELSRLSVGDVDLDAGDVTIQPYNASKKSRPRTIPLGSAAITAVWKYKATDDYLQPVWHSSADNPPCSTQHPGKHLDRLGTLWR